MIIPQRIVLGILLGALLEYLIVIVSYLTGVVLHTPTTEPRVVTVVGIRFQTTVEIYDMVIIEHIVILQAGTHIPTKDTPIGTFKDTTIVKYGVFYVVSIERILIKEGIIVTNYRSITCPIGLRLIGMIVYEVLL